MRFYSRVFVLAVPLLVFFSSYSLYQCHAGEKDTRKDEVVMQLMMKIIRDLHYNPVDINDEFSHKVYDLYLKRNDYNKKLFLQSDLDTLKKYYDQIDDEVKGGSFEFFNKALDILDKRTAEDQTYYRDILSKPFDFTQTENVELDPDKMTYAKDATEMKEAWRKYMKYQVLVRYADAKKEQEKAKAENKPDFKEKSDVELEEDARKKVLKTEDEIFERLSKVDRNDRMSVYLNVLTSMYDPHTEFFPAKDKANFDITMSGQLEGIGATLQEKDGGIKVSSIVPGSPSWKQGQLKAGDVILKVAQGNADPVEISGMKIDDAVKLIRGKKGTEVRLTIKKPDGSILTISIIRDVVVLEDTFASSSIIKKDNQKIGFIRLPSFYADFTGSGAHSCADDMKAELEKLKKEKVDGVVIDLRDNGGGSLQEVIKMAGLFIDYGPVVQVKSRDKYVKVYDDKSPGVTYDGPLALLVNENSASASEILAAAMQDYKRGVIIGSKSSFGKGSVQQFYDLDMFAGTNNVDLRPLGSVKVTIQKFYRINGGATQLKGVIPDVVLPDLYSEIDDEGEKDLDNPMPWDEISPAFYQTWSKAPNYDKIKTNSDARVKADPAFKLIAEKAQELKTDRDNSLESLKYDDYLAHQKLLDADKDKYKVLDEAVKGMTVSLVPVDEKELKNDTTTMARKKDWLERLQKDEEVGESVAILKDWK